MQASNLIVGWFSGLKGVHLSRLKCVAKVTAAVLVANRLALSLVGRSVLGVHKAKNGIKCVDRLLGNVKLHAEIGLFYAKIATLLMPRKQRERPVLLIDWTDIGTLWAALVVTFVSEGRGVVLCSEVHPRKKENNPRVESSVLKRVRELLPPGTTPIIISDAGFRGPWLRKVLNEGWDFVGRVRGRVKVRAAGSRTWVPVKNLWERATPSPRDFGTYALARYLPMDARVVAVWKNKTKHSKGQPTPRKGRRQAKAIRSAREPWILATSMSGTSPREVVRLYALRMRIELTFRDQKCPRFGLALDQIQTENRKRVEVYLLLATLAHYVAMFIGQAAEREGRHLDYQANTVKKRRVLSWARLGREILHRAVLEAMASVLPKLDPRLALALETHS